MTTRVRRRADLDRQKAKAREWLRFTALDRGLGAALTPAQVRELVADYDAVVRKANRVVQEEYGTHEHPTNPDWV